MSSGVHIVKKQLPGLRSRCGQWVLIHRSGEYANVGDTIATFRGDTVVLEGGSEPLHSGSSGRIYVRYLDGTPGQYFPSVADLKWVRP